MKKNLSLITLSIFAFGTMMANWQPSDMEAIRLDKEGSNGQVQMKTIRTDDGKIILSWLRSERTGNVFSYQLHLQLFDAEGNAMFGDEGIIVCDKRTRTWTTDYALALAPNGDILLAYTDIRNDPNEENAESYLYRYSQQGEPVWDVDGILFPTGKIHETAFVVEDVAPAICVSGNNIFAAVNHTEYFMEEANEDNWSPSPWFPNQEMPDSVQVNDAGWLIISLNDDGTINRESPLEIKSTILSMNPAPNGNVYAVYNNDTMGLDVQLLNAGLNNIWENPVNLEQSAISAGVFVPTPLTDVNNNGVLMLSYRIPTNYYGYQVVNSITPEGNTPGTGLTLAGDFDGDAGSAAMGIKDEWALVAWEYAYSTSEYRMKANMVNQDCNYAWNGDNTNGIILEVNDLWGFKPVKVIPVNTGWVVLYGNCTSWNGANFMVVKLDDAGYLLWSKQICEDDFKTNGLSVTYDENNAYIFYTQEVDYDDNWNEIPGSGGMFVMCVDIAGEINSSINDLQNNANVISTEIYTVDGRRVNQLQDGVNIIRIIDGNGDIKTKKVIKND